MYSCCNIDENLLGLLHAPWLLLNDASIIYTCVSSPIAAPAKIVVVPEDTYATEGNTLILTCVAHGTPSPAVTWLKDGAYLMNTSRVFIYNEHIEVDGVWFVQSILEICDLEVKNDTGNYSCEATNYLDLKTYTDRRSFRVDVEPRGLFQ